MDLQNLKKAKMIKKSKRLGRGESSGKGKTSGKGYKGQKARGKVRLGFEGGQLPLIKRLPFRRGVGNRLGKEKMTITLDQLNIFASGDIVDEKSLREKGLILKSARPKEIKLVAKGQINKQLTIKIKTSVGAKTKVEKIKGKVLTSTEVNKDEQHP